MSCCPCGYKDLPLDPEFCMPCDSALCTLCTISRNDDIILCGPCNTHCEITQAICSVVSCTNSDLMQCPGQCKEWFCKQCIEIHPNCNVCYSAGCVDFIIDDICKGCGRDGFCKRCMQIHLKDCPDTYFCFGCMQWTYKPQRCNTCIARLCSHCDHHVACEGCNLAYCSKQNCGVLRVNARISNHQDGKCPGIRRCPRHTDQYTLGICPETTCHVPDCNRISCLLCLIDYQPDHVYKLPICNFHSFGYLSRKQICPCCHSMYPKQMVGHYYLKKRQPTILEVEVCYGCFLTVRTFIECVMHLYTFPKEVIDCILTYIK